jgi:hypothetical protein
MNKQLLEDENREQQHAPVVQQKYPRHPITMENRPEETTRRMRAFPERAAKLKELIRGLREESSL